MDRHILKSEFLKFFSYHWSIFGVIGAVLLPPIALLLTLNTLPETSLTIESFIVYCLRFLYLGQVGIIIAMAGFISQEYSHSTLCTTLLSNPSRIKLMLSKEIVMIFTTVISLTLASSLCFVVIITNDNFSELVNINFIIKNITYILPTFISWISLGLISGNLTVITKSLVVPIAILFPMILGLSQMILAITKLAIYLPDLAVMNIFQVETQKIFLAPQIGIAIQFLWLVLIFLVAIYSFKKRDIH